MHRRHMLYLLAGATSSLLTGGFSLAAEAKKRLGIVEHSYGQRMAADKMRNAQPPLSDPLAFLEFCRERGAGGIQIVIGNRDASYVGKLREKAEAAHMYIEGSIRLPGEQKDVERFAAEVRTARDAGATVLRTVLTNGRRYEIFDSLDGFKQARERAWKSLLLAEPIVKKLSVRLAIENHKDWRIAELLDILKRMDSRHIGVCVDTGNSIALLEDPLETVEAYAPFAYSVHFKDMAVQEYEEGFLLSEVPLGDGFLDLAKLVQVLTKAQPRIQFNLEMITRDPLKIPCLTKKYWATMGDVAGQRLADMLAKAKANKKALPRVGNLDQEARLKVEDDNVKRCLEYAGKNLELYSR